MDESWTNAASQNACSKWFWRAFSENIMGSECEDGPYFKAITARRNSSKKLLEIYKKSLPDNLSEEERLDQITYFQKLLSDKSKQLEMSSENVSNRIQSKVNAGQSIYQGVLGGLMIAASGGLAGPVASVELANLGKTAAALANLGANATGYYYAADTLKTMTNAGINFLSKDNLSGWCSLTNETLLKGDRPFEEMWKEGITVGGFGVVFGGVGGAALKSSSSIIKGIGITGVTAGIGFLGKDILYDREQEVEK